MKKKYSLKQLLIENENMEQLELDFMQDEIFQDIEGKDRVEILDDVFKNPGGETFKSDETPIDPDPAPGAGQMIDVELADGTTASYEHAPQSGEQLKLPFMYDEEGSDDGLDRNVIEPDFL